MTEAPALIALVRRVLGDGLAGVPGVQSPFLTEHSEPDHRNELFAVQFAIQSVTNIIAAVLGGFVASWSPASIGLDPDGRGPTGSSCVIMCLLMVAALATVTRLSDDRPGPSPGRGSMRLGEPAAFPSDPRRSRRRLGIVVRDRALFARLLSRGS